MRGGQLLTGWYHGDAKGDHQLFSFTILAISKIYRPVSQRTPEPALTLLVPLLPVRRLDVHPPEASIARGAVQVRDGVRPGSAGQPSLGVSADRSLRSSRLPREVLMVEFMRLIVSCTRL